MKSLFAKIMLAQVAAVVLALLVVMFITRLSLDRGFISFLERQEGAVLAHLAPALGQLYAKRGGWDFLRDNPENWLRILHRTRHMGGAQGDNLHAEERAPRFRQLPRHPAPDGEAEPLRWLRSLDRLELRDRLFVLDDKRSRVAGPSVELKENTQLQAVMAEGNTVGWVGFAPVRRQLPPEAHRFMSGQLRAHLMALAVALVVVAGVAFALARHLSKPVRLLDSTVNDLSRGRFDRRAEISTADEIGHLARNVNQLAETLQANRSARHRWMTDIAHELRTPVAILKGEIEALGDGVRQAEQKTIASLAEEIDHLSILVEDLQSLALADAGALILNRKSENLQGLAEQVCAAFTDRLSRRGIGLDLQAPHAVSANVDAQRIRQLLGNLLENCVRYTSQGGRVRVSLTEHPLAVEMVVEDSGPGVDISQLDRLFQRFYRGEEGRSRAGGGSGLGLAICRGIAEAHGGRIWAEASELGGLAIRMTIPG